MKPLLVLNQSQPPAFQRMIEAAAAPAPVRFLNGQGVVPARLDTKVLAAPVYDRRSVLHRAQSWAAYLASALIHTVRQHGFVLAVTNPPFLPHVAWAVSQIGRLRYGLLIWDIYPGHLHNIGWLGSTSPLFTAWERVNDVAIDQADFVVTIGDQMARALRSRPGRRHDIHVIPNWADTAQIRPIPRQHNPLRSRLQVRDELVVMYSGNLGASHGLDGLLDAAAALRDNTDICFRVVGNGLGRGRVEAAVAQRRLTNVRVYDPFSWEEFPLAQALADVAVVTQAPGTEHLSVPSKSYSALAAGSALLALTTAASDLGQMVEGYGVGRVCGFAAGKEISGILAGWAERRDELAAFQRRARELAISDYSAERVTERWRNLLLPSLLTS